MDRRWLVVLLAGVLGLALVVSAGCGSGTNTTPTTPKTTPKTTPSSGSTSISIIDFAFQPSTTTITVGTTVTWKNNGAVAHTVTSDTGAFDSGQLQPGASYTHTFNASGAFPYHCANHPTQMLATITVTGTTGGGTTTSPLTSTPVNPSPTPSY